MIGKHAAAARGAILLAATLALAAPAGAEPAATQVAQLGGLGNAVGGATRGAAAAAGGIGRAAGAALGGVGAGGPGSQGGRGGGGAPSGQGSGGESGGGQASGGGPTGGTAASNERAQERDASPSRGAPAGRAPSGGGGIDRGDPGALDRAAQGSLSVLGTPGAGDHGSGREAPSILPWREVLRSLGPRRPSWAWPDDPIAGQPVTPTLLRGVPRAEEANLIGSEWR